MWVNFVWLCKGANDDKQLQATTALIQVSLQKYYLLLIFFQCNRCRKLVLLKSSRMYLKKHLHSRERDISIFILAVTLHKSSIFFNPVPWMAVKTNTSTYIKSESSRHMIMGTSSLRIIVRCLIYNPIICADEKTLKTEAKILRSTTLPTFRRVVFSWRFTGFTDLMLWQEQHRD
jgi:hypothetical protein